MSSPVHNDILARVATYYGQKIAHHGATPQGVDWKDAASHALRHEQFLRLLGQDRDASILDLGCGYGDFLSFLRAHGHRGPYQGWDVAEGMIAQARKLHGEGPDRQFCVGATPDTMADYAIASGIFNVRGDVPAPQWSAFVDSTIAQLASLARRGFAFNVLSLSSDPERRRPDLHYVDPAAMLAHLITHYGRSVALLQDYGLYEFTALVRLPVPSPSR